MRELLAGLREADDGDAAGLAALIGGVYAEYPGCVLDLPGVDHDLTGIRTHLAARGGRLWVLPDVAGLRACVGYAPAGDRVELKRLYVTQDARRSGVGTGLTAMVVDLAATLQAAGVDLWSDTRFEDAHRHYEKHGWVLQPDTRYLHDPSDSTEFHFTRELAAPSPPDAAATWRSGTDEIEDTTLTRNRLGLHLQGRSRQGAWRWAVTTDERGHTRDATLTTADGRTVHLTSDGRGRWWRDGKPDRDLDGCTDVDIAVTPGTNTLPVLRALMIGADRLDVTAAWIRWPDLSVQPSAQRYTSVGDGAWRYESLGHSYRLEVDEWGLVRRYGDLFVAVSPGG